MSKRGVGLLHHSHSGRKVPIHYTSYALLFFLLVLTGATLVFAGQAAKADQQIQGDISLSGKVNGPPPATAPSITKPTTGSHFSDNITGVQGTCTAGLLVEIYRYDIFAGSVICDSQDTFTLTITLIPGANDLKARMKDGGGQYSPDSAVVTVYYDVPAGLPGSKTSSGSPTIPGIRPFLIYTEPVQRGVANGQGLKLKYELNGGKPPYAIAINWGDGSPSDVFSQADEGDFTAEHKFTQGGQYTVSISGGDALHSKAFIQTTAVMQGPNKAAAIVQSACEDPSTAASTYCAISNQLIRFINSVWLAFIVACLMTISFWLGERVIYKRMNHAPKHAH